MEFIQHCWTQHVKNIEIFDSDYFLTLRQKIQCRSLLSEDAILLPETGFFRTD